MARRRALLIACSEYSDAKLLPLASTLADVRSLREVLEDANVSDFEVEVLENPTSYELSHTLERFYMETKLHDTALVYHSGHGVKSTDGRLFLAARNTDTNFLASTAVPAAFLQEQILSCRSRQKVLVLDCCYAGAFTRGSRHRAASSVNLQDAFSGGKGTVYIASSGATQYSWEGDNVEGCPQPSCFTQCLIEGLKSGAADLDGDGLIGVRELYDYVVDEISDLTPNQRPEFSSQEYTEIYLAKTVPPVVEEPVAEPEPEPEVIAEPVVVAASLTAFDLGSPKSSAPVEAPPIHQTAPPPSGPPVQQAERTEKPPAKFHPIIYIMPVVLIGMFLLSFVVPPLLGYFKAKPSSVAPTTTGSTDVPEPYQFSGSTTGGLNAGATNLPLIDNFGVSASLDSSDPTMVFVRYAWETSNADLTTVFWPDGKENQYFGTEGSREERFKDTTQFAKMTVGIKVKNKSHEVTRLLALYRRCKSSGEVATAACGADWEFATIDSSEFHPDLTCTVHK